jgi:hypothetical protein
VNVAPAHLQAVAERLLGRGPHGFERVIEVDERQRTLTERHILPVLPRLEEEFREIREGVDRSICAELAARPEEVTDVEPDRSRNRYPRGFCLPITTMALTRFVERGLGPNPSEGFQAVWRFHEAGGVVGRIWGVLRERYFQNAIQLGSHYFDVANDTVDVSKPKIEHMPLAESGFRNIRSIADFVEIGERYWGCRLLPNLHFARLIPVVPLLRLDADEGLLRPCVFGDFMRRLNVFGGFRETEALLLAAVRDGPRLPEPWPQRIEAYRRRHLPKASAVPLEGVDAETIERLCRHARQGWNGAAMPSEVMDGLWQAAKRILISGGEELPT